MNNKIKQEFYLEDKKIVLFEFPDNINKDYQSISTIKAFGPNDTLLWTAEPPRSHYEFYYEMRVDKDKNVLIGITGSGLYHEMNIDDGKVSKFYLVK